MLMQFVILHSNGKQNDCSKKIGLLNLNLNTYFKDLFSLYFEKKKKAK